VLLGAAVCREINGGAKLQENKTEYISELISGMEFKIKL
jgi:hypothetical protein